MTGSNVGCPSKPVVLNHVFVFQSGLVVYSIEKPSGEVDNVLVMEMEAMHAGHGEHNEQVVDEG